MLITAIELRKKALRAVYLDGVLAADVDADTLALSGLRVGDEITRQAFDDLCAQSDLARAKSRALFLLNRRSYSKKELIEKVRAASGAQAAQAAVDRMEELGLVNDLDYARRFAADCLHLKKYGVARILQELCRRGIDRDTARLALEPLAPEDPAEQIAALLQTKFSRNREDEKGKRRTIAALQRMGYRWDDIRRAMRQSWEERLESQE